MTTNKCHLLLISDNLAYIQLIEQLLSQSKHYSFSDGLSFCVTQVDCLAEAIKSLEERTFAVILVDLLLPHNQGIPTFVQLREQFPTIPIIVQTENPDENLIVQAMQLGADGYLYQKTLDSSLLIYQIRLAIERQKYLAGLKRSQAEKQQELEFRELENLTYSSTSITARLFGADLLRETLPELFAELVSNYGELLDLSLEQKAYKVEYDLSEKLRTLADKLGFLKASPRDIVEIHTTTIREKNQDVPLAKAQAYVSEGRLLVLQLMGYLASFYRKYYIGLSNIKLASPSNPPQDHE